MVDMHERIELNPMVCHGKPVIKGTRVMVSAILGALAAGDTAEMILEDFPHMFCSTKTSPNRQPGRSSTKTGSTLGQINQRRCTKDPHQISESPAWDQGAIGVW